MPSNNDYVLLDEGVLDSIIKLWKYAANFKSNYNTTNAKIKADRLTHTSSIARAAKNLTMSFPTVCSDAVSGSTAAIINKAIELKNVTMIQMVAAAAHFTGFNGIDVVNKIHSNIGVNYNVDDYIDSILSFKDAFEKTKFESYIPLTGTYRILAEQLKQEFLESCNHVYPVSSFNEIAISNYYVVDSYGSPKVMYEAINPYSYEYALQIVNHITFQSAMHIMPFAHMFCSFNVIVGNVHTTGVCYFTVNNNNLSVVTCEHMIDEREGDRVKLIDLYAETANPF